jgi:lysophospholipase L1-like esterase
MRSPLPPFRVFLALLTLVPALLRAEPAVIPFAKWEKEIAALEAKDPVDTATRGGIVFIGSSSIKKWTTLAQDFPRHRVLNHGFGGSQMADSVHFAERIVLPYEPRFIVVYAGGNDLNAGKKPEQVCADFGAFVEKVRAKLPQTGIAYIAIAPNPKRWVQVEQVQAANALIADYIKGQPGLKFIDVYPRMLGADGLPLPNIFVADRLHMNAEGYKLWTEIVGAALPAPDR